MKRALPGAIAAKLAYLRLQPFDVSTPQGRTAERYRLAAWATLANLASRVGMMLVMVLGVTLTVGYLGRERFGAWAVLSSLVGMLSFLDLGVGNAMINRVAHAAATGKPDELRRVVGGGLAWLALVGASAGALLAAVGTLLPWDRLMTLSSPDIAAEVATASQVLGVLFGLNLLSGGCLKVLVGQQRAHEAHLLTLCGACISIICIWIAASHQVGIPVLLMAGFGVQALIGLLAVPMLVYRRQLSGAELGTAMAHERRPLFRTGGVFFALQIGSMIGWGFDSLLLASVRSASDVAALAIAQRLFQFASQPVVVLNGPLWAAYADANARDDRQFLRNTLARSFKLSIGVATLISVALLGLSPWIIPMWTDNTIDVPLVLLLAFFIWTTIEAGGTAFGTYLNGAGLVREQIVVVAAFCLVALPLKLLAAKYYGAAGMVFATSISYSLTVILLYSTVLRRRVLSPLTEPHP